MCKRVAAALHTFTYHLTPMINNHGPMSVLLSWIARSACRIALLCLLTCRSYAESPVVDNDLVYRIKAAYLYNLSKFIQWPNEVRADQSPIDICLMGSNPFKEYIFKLEQRQARGRPIKIIQQPAADKLSQCDMMFFPIDDPQTDHDLMAVKDRNILTVGESETFIQQGGLINLSLENGRVQLTINNSKARQHGFTISANLLEIARQVD